MSIPFFRISDRQRGVSWKRRRPRHSNRPRNLRFRPMCAEALEERMVMSALSPLQPAVSMETAAKVPEDLVSSSAVYAPAIPGEGTLHTEGLSLPEDAAAGSILPGQPSEKGTDRTAARLTDVSWTALEGEGIRWAERSSAALAAAEEVSETAVGDMGEELTDDPAQSLIPGIPPGDAGGLAGGNGGGRLPLEIPGFGGYGNAYYLTNVNEPLARVIWLYAQYFNDQQRVAPSQTELPRSRTDYSSSTTGLFGTSLGGMIYYDEIDGDGDAKPPEEEEMPKIEEENALPKSRSEEPRIEHHLEQELEHTLQKMIPWEFNGEIPRSWEKYELRKPQIPEVLPKPQELPEIWKNGEEILPEYGPDDGSELLFDRTEESAGRMKSDPEMKPEEKPAEKIENIPSAPKQEGRPRPPQPESSR